MRWALLVICLAGACTTKLPIAVPPEPEEPIRIIVLPDVPDDTVICIAIPSGMLPYTKEVSGLHCETVGTLRWWMGSLRKTDH